MTHPESAPPLRNRPRNRTSLAAALIARVGLAAGLAAGLAGPAAAQSAVSLSSPVGGWRWAPTDQRDFVQVVNYPAANVNTEGISAAAQIRGRIAKLPKAASAEGPRQPARLIVDGIAMPLLQGPDGSFARPWSFGAGAHGVQVIAPGGSSADPAASRRTQFFEANAGRPGVRLRVVLSWDSDQTDLDLHVISPDGEHVWYGQRRAANGGALDVDVTTGFGPEIYAIPRSVPGVYSVYVNYYGSGDVNQVITTAQVAIIEDEGTGRERQQVFRVPLRKPGELTLIRRFRVS